MLEPLKIKQLGSKRQIVSTTIGSTTSPTPTTRPTTSISSTSNGGSSSTSLTLPSASSTLASSSLLSSVSSTPTQSSTTSQIPTSTFSATTMVTTNANGQSVTTILSTLVPTSTSTGSGNSSASHIGPIVGGTIGGLAALVIVALIIVFCLRRQRGKDEFDGNFDPDRVGHAQPGQLDLTAGEVEPYTYPQGGTDMREAAQYPYTGPVTGAAAPGSHEYHDMPQAGSEYMDTRLSPTAAATTAYSATSSAPSQPRSAKEREAYSRYQNVPYDSSAGASGSTGPGMQVVNQYEEQGGAADRVVVHQDGGRVIPEVLEDERREIPPTYDSIPTDDTKR